MSSPAWIVLTVIAAALGFAIAWVNRSKAKAGVDAALAAAGADLRGKDLLIEELRRRRDEAETKLDEEKAARAAASEALAELRGQNEAQKLAADEKLGLLQNAERMLKDSFGALAATALDTNAKQLMELNKAELEKRQQAATRELEAKESSIANMLKPVKESLAQIQEHSQQLEVQREGAYKVILVEIENMRTTHADLRRETSQLVHALRAPKTRGDWGQMQLRRCVEYAGMIEHASFDVEQVVRRASDEKLLRPDMVIYLPNGRSIIVDSKAPYENFLKEFENAEPTDRNALLSRHAEAVRGHMNDLAGKAYWNQFKESPDFVVCFLPSEGLFSAALEGDSTLLEHGDSRVLLATPTTLIALLKAVAYGWQQSQIARDAQLIRDEANKVHSKLVGMHRAFVSLGDALNRAGKCYEDAMVKAEGRGGIFSIARKLRELHIGEEDLADSKALHLQARVLTHEDWDSGLALAASAGADENAVTS